MKILIGLFVLAVLLVGTLLSLPFLVDLNKYQDQYKPLIEEALNRKVQLQDIRLTIWPRIGATVAGFAVMDDPSFGSGPFASLSSLDVGVKLMPLLSGQVEVEEVTLRNPVITVIKNKNGVLNASTIGRKGVAVPEAPSKAPIPSAEGPLKILALLAVDRVSIDGGKLTYRDQSVAKMTEYVLQDLEVLLRDVRLGQTPNVHVASLVQPFNMPVKLDGTFGPLKDTMDVDAINFQLERRERRTLPLQEKQSRHSATVNVSSPVINTANLPIALPLKKPVEIKNLQIAAEVKGQEAKLNTLSFQLFEARSERARQIGRRVRYTAIQRWRRSPRSTTRSGAQCCRRDAGFRQRNSRCRSFRTRAWVLDARFDQGVAGNRSHGREGWQDPRREYPPRSGVRSERRGYFNR